MQRILKYLCASKQNYTNYLMGLTSNGSVQIMLFKDRLEIWNPGCLPYGLTPEKLHHPHKSLPANPLLAEPMYLSGLIEKMGTGTEDIVKECRDQNLPMPEFRQEFDFCVTIWRKRVDENTNESTNVVKDVVKGGANVVKDGAKDFVVV